MSEDRYIAVRDTPSAFGGRRSADVTATLTGADRKENDR